MYVVGVSSKLSNTIFTYKMCFLSFLSPLASNFPLSYHRQEAVWLLFGKHGHLNTPDQLWPYCCCELWIWGVRRAGYISFWTILICHISHPSALHSALVSGPGHTQCWLCQQSCCDTFTPLVPQLELDPVLATLPCVVTLVWGAAWNQITE